MDSLPIFLEINDIYQSNQTFSVAPPEYVTNQPTAENIQLALAKLQINTARRHQANALFHAFFLGYLLEKIGYQARRAQRLPAHFRIIATRVYEIFEGNPGILAYLRITTVQHIRRLKREEVKELRTLVFAGAQTLGEEPVTQ